MHRNAKLQIAIHNTSVANAMTSRSGRQAINRTPLTRMSFSRCIHKLSGNEQNDF